MQQTIEVGDEPCTVLPRRLTTAVSGGGLVVEVNLPDAENGAYRGPRFSWAGNVAQATYCGHTWFGQWRSSPTAADSHDCVTGTAGEFGMGSDRMPPPLGYRTARPGGSFVKIGVGVLRRIKERGYRFHGPYEILEAAPWDIETGADYVEMTQSLVHHGYGYRYKYRLHVLSETPAFVVSHSLTNIGIRPIEQTHYSHNFFVFDNQPVGRGCKVTFPFDIAVGRGKLGAVIVEERAISFAANVKAGGGVFGTLGGYGAAPSENAVTVENATTGTGVRITGDKPVVRFHLFATSKAICPEPFVSVNVLPGETKEWSQRYDLLLGHAM